MITKRQGRIFLIVLFAQFFLMKPSFLFAQGILPATAKERAIIVAFREEAMRTAFQDAEMKSLFEDYGQKSSSASILSFFHPHASLYTSYNENIFLINDNVQNDLINTLTPGVKLILGSPEDYKTQHRLELDTGAVLTYYRDNPELNREKPYATLAYRFGKNNNTLNFDYSFKRLSGMRSSLLTDASGIIDYQYYQAALDWESTYNRLGFDLGYNKYAYLYESDVKASNSYQEEVLITTLFFQAFPKTRFLLEYDHGVNEYFKSATSANDSRYNRLWLGVKGDLTRKTSGLVKFGYEMRDYKDGVDYKASTIDVDVSSKLSAKTTFLLSISRESRDATYIGEGLNSGYSFSFSCNYALNRKLKADLGFIDYSLDDYSDGRKDKTGESSIKLNYLFRKWMKMGLKISHKERNSTLANAGYKNTVYTMNMDVMF